jgi:hypothetical protein
VAVVAVEAVVAVAVVEAVVVEVGVKGKPDV